MKGNKFSVLVLCILLSGCAHYHSSLGKNEKYQTLAVNLFHNDSFQLGLEEKLTNSMIEELLADGRVDVENESNAELIIDGRIKRYTRSILSLDSNDNVTLYQLTISVDIDVLNTQSKETIVRIPNINTSTTYVPTRSNIEFETETDAQKRLLEDLSEEIVYQLLDKNQKSLTKHIGES